jgi:hypothetical protein
MAGLYTGLSNRAVGVLAPQAQCRLKENLRCHHHAAGCAQLVGDDPERALCHRTIRIGGVHVIEQILRFEPQLQIFVLSVERAGAAGSLKAPSGLPVR